MTELRTAHTAELPRSTLTAVRALLDEVFHGELTDHDWDHSLGGIHALLWDGDSLIGHASVIQRRLLHRGRAIRTGYVEGVGVREDRRRFGYGAALLSTLERYIHGGFELGALAATDEAFAFYRARGWLAWQGPTFALTPTGMVRTEDVDGGVFVLPGTASLDVSGDLICDWRDGDAW